VFVVIDFGIEEIGAAVQVVVVHVVVVLQVLVVVVFLYVLVTGSYTSCALTKARHKKLMRRIVPRRNACMRKKKNKYTYYM
jgi:hypothetical protein